LKPPIFGHKKHVDATIFWGTPCCQKMAISFNVEFLQQNKSLRLLPSHYQADTLLIIGNVSHKQAPILEKMLTEMILPTNVIHFIGCERLKKTYASIDKLATLIPQTLEILVCPSTDKDTEYLAARPLSFPFYS